MGERGQHALRGNFESKVRLQFHGVKVASDAGLPAYQELDRAPGLTSMIESDFYDKHKRRRPITFGSESKK